MKSSFHTVRHSLLSRGMKYLIALILLLGAVMLYLLSTASANTPLFATDVRLLLSLGVVIVLGLAGVVGYQLLALRRRLRARLFGSKLTLRLVLLFALVAVLPGALVYAVSVQFLSKSIESWFNVRVDKALDAGLSLARTALDNLQRDLGRKAEAMAVDLSDVPPARLVSTLERLREQAALQEVAVFGTDGSVVAFSGNEQAALMPLTLPPAAVRQILLQQSYRSVEQGGSDNLLLRAVVPVNPAGGHTQALQLVQAVAASMARDMSTVQSMYQDYQELSLARGGLKRLYGLSLTLALLLALLTSLVLAVLFSERLTAPLVLLAAGTRAIAQGDFSLRHPVRSHDELGVLTESFNTMTRQLADARATALRNHEEVQAARAYLETVLAKLSAGVLSFDADHRLRSTNPSASEILRCNLERLVGVALEDWPARQPDLAGFVDGMREALQPGRAQTWDKQLELSDGGKVLLLRGSGLAEGGAVIVFDDITRLLQAQRYAAWGEVARRLAHEIKNPLTPIQLSAERLEHRLADKLESQDAQVLVRSTQTIVKQVAQLKGMVDAFSQYARTPEMQLQPLDLNQLVREVLVLYDTQRLGMQFDLADKLPCVMGDPARLRQVIHNLLQNAEQATADRERPQIQVRTEHMNNTAVLRVVDNGGGFPPDILGRAFEPYVTTKAKGTGLGLAIVKKIIEEHQGNIEVANVRDGGAQVSLWLPVYQVVAQDDKESNAKVG